MRAAVRCRLTPVGCDDYGRYDQINPDHYRFPNGEEVIGITEQLSFNLGNVVKYVARAGRKPEASVLTDLSKALWYLEREISRLGFDLGGGSR